VEATLAEPKCFPLQKNRTASPHPKSALGGGRLIHSKGARTSAGQILLGPSPRPFPPLQRAGRSQIPGLGVIPIWPASCSRVGPPRRPTSRSIPRGPRPALPAPGPADPAACIPALLASAIGAAAGGSPVRRTSASWWQPEGAHCLLLAPGLRCGAVCGLPGVRECMPWRLPADPTATPRQPNRPIAPRKR
jgi:hypothetical protein